MNVVKYEYGHKQTDNFIFDYCEKWGDNLYLFKNTNTGDFIVIFKYQIKGYSAL